ncbi:MAG TPA: thiolase family protein [Acidimicrobiales bacterium]|jgi:acetyl-CoA acetyltransferase|nr:thiolase family protein [Acidimicrobiales bacterium]
MMHPFRDVAVLGVHNTPQARRLPGHDSSSIALQAALGALTDAGLAVNDVDGVVGQAAADAVLELGIGPCTRRPNGLGIPSILDAAALVTTGQCRVVIVLAGGAGLLSDTAAAPWTTPPNELVAGFGLFTAAEFALMARRHMVTFGTTEHQLARAAAVVRNNGHQNPDAIYYGRGPFTPEDILASPLVAEPFHLLDCATTSEGGCALVLGHADVARGNPRATWILGCGSDSYGPAYTVAPVWDLTGRAGTGSAGWVGARAAQASFAMAGLSPSDVDVAEFYDPFSFEIIRQLEAYGFCEPGQGGPMVESGAVGPGGSLPVTTDGGTMSFSHPGVAAQQFQRVVRGVQQIRGECTSMQVAGAEVALCSNGGSGALFADVVLLGRERP